MERKFVPVEQRGKGRADDDSDVPNHLRNVNPHSDHTDTKAGSDGVLLLSLFSCPF